MNMIYILPTIALLYILSLLYQNKKNRNKVICIAEDSCVGCQACIKRCKRNVLAIETTEEGYVVAVVKNPNKCTGCGGCIKKCQFDAMELQSRILKDCK